MDEPSLASLLEDAARRAQRYLASVGDRRVFPDAASLDGLSRLYEPLPDEPSDPAETLRLLDEIASPATVASAGPRYFGFVIGGSLPVTVAASWLANAWDQPAGLRTASPAAIALEEACAPWILDLLRLPSGAAVGFTTGATVGNLCGLAAARHALLARQDWDVETRGLFGAPELRVVVGDEVHVSLLKALSLLGLGRERVQRVPVDEQGRMQADAVPDLDESTIVCLQAGNVNSGSFDPASKIVPKARKAKAWVHVDGAFGLWAAASPMHAILAEGFGEADSWSVDAHKWLNVPYDSGFVVARRPEDLAAAMATQASYLEAARGLEPFSTVPEMSRRARGVEVWAALRHLGRKGVAALVDRCCRHAQRFADGCRKAGFEVLNDVVLNQVVVRFGDDAKTRRVIDALTREGTAWAGGTTWKGKTAMRVSFSSWATRDEDVDRTVVTLDRLASEAA